MKKLIYGIGTNDADYSLRPMVGNTRVRCKIYSKWYDMLKRCYSERYQTRFPTYVGCTVCDEWLTFSKFKAWMETQDWEAKELDKDLLVSGNKVYGPDTCIFVSQKINSLTIFHASRRGEYPIGLYFNKSKRKLKSQVNINSKVTHLGYFDCPHQAHQAWQRAKIAIIRDAAKEENDERLVAALNRIADKVQGDLDIDIETTHY